MTPPVPRQRSGSGYGTSTVRSPGGSGRVQMASTSARGIAVGLTANLPPSDRDALSQLISRLLVAHATGQEIDLFATIKG
jgi:hypothetical protein